MCRSFVWHFFQEEDAHGRFEVVHAGTDAAMFAELESAYQRKAPILLWIYSPHWATSKYQGEWVQFPEYTPDCYAKKLYTCGKPHGEIRGGK